MKPHLQIGSRKSEVGNSKGVALVVVLGMLVLVLVLVVAFLSSVSVELQSAKKYSSGADARALADSAVSLVISQIQDATTTPQLAWASQPGMIRTYTGSGTLHTAYKLYSSDTMRVAGNFDPVANQATEVPANWAGNPSLFTDLNKPAAVSGTNRYPILDPEAVASDASGGTPLVGSDPIDGCFLDTNNPSVSTAAQLNPVPMPVQWLYVLSSGTLAAVSPGTGTVIGATKNDPIVGRIAFWTDDETSKVNINTASEGTFWDRPWARTPFENKLNESMPVQNEFQRYPGHPAMTSLSPIFPPLPGEAMVDYNERIYGIIPRVAGGGSMSGTELNAGANWTTGYSTPDADRLFASVDELMFQSQSATRQENLKGPGVKFTERDLEKVRFFLTANSRAPEVNQFNKPRVTLWPLQIDPDPNTGDKTRTAKDKLIAFCSTVGNIPYYFQRFNTYSFERNIRPAGTDNWSNKQIPMPSSQSPTMDWSIPRNQAIFTYLRTLASNPIPGLGGSLSSKYPRSLDQTLVEMLDFIRSTVNPQRTLDATVPSGADDIEYFYAPGYKRVSPAYYNVIGQQQVAPMEATMNGNFLGKGFGRFPSIKQAVLIFQASNKDDYKTKSAGTVVDTPAMNQGPMRMRAVLLLDPFNVTPGFPSVCPNVRYRVRWTRPCLVNDVAIPFASPAVNLITARDTERNQTALGAIEYSYKYYEKPNSNDSDHHELPKTLGDPVVGSSDEEKFYPFYSQEMTVPGVASGTPTFAFKGGDLEIDVFPGYSQTLNEADRIQTIRMSFPKFMEEIDGVVTELPVTLPRPTFENTRVGTVYEPHRLTDFNERLKNPGLEPGYSHGLKPLIRPVDTVRSVEASPAGPARGDLRVYAALRDVPDSYFGVGPGYSTTIARVHGLRIYPYNLNGNNSTLYTGFVQARLGKLVAGVNYYDSPSDSETFHNPIVPNDLTEARMSNGLPGDWDTGPGVHVDGPFINKADMGNNGRFNSYFGLGNNSQTFAPNENGATYSPNRQISSAVAFGSLPTGINPSNASDVEPWRTALFGKHPAAGSAHPGFGQPVSGPPYNSNSPPDHAFLDFFTMPIVEPYAISEPFSTAGKVNMNYQMVPFTYLTRATAVRAVLKSTLMTAIPTGDGLTYKLSNPADYRYTIDPDEKTGTLKGFEDRFRTGDIFRSASEICDISLVPKERVDGASVSGSPDYDDMESWWNDYKLTGDNVREQPYGHIYPRLTTKSNTFTVHVTAQSISKSKATPADQFVEGKDQITGEFRGSFLIERYLDPNSDSLVKADQKTVGSELDPDSMVGPYKFRVINSKKFAP